MSPKTPDPTDRHVGSRVRLRRIVMGMTQTQLGDHLGVTFQQVQKYEQGKNRIAQVLEVPVSFFFEGHEGAGAVPTEGAGEVRELLSDRSSVELVRAFNKIGNATVRRAILSIARASAVPRPTSPTSVPDADRADAGSEGAPARASARGGRARKPPA